MKLTIKRGLSLVLMITLFTACAPQLHFLGDTYPPTTEVDTYYSIEDVDRDFRVIGQLTGTNQTSGAFKNLEEIKESMVKEAMKRGAHGILFLFSESYGYDHIVKADLIRYKR